MPTTPDIVFELRATEFDPNALVADLIDAAAKAARYLSVAETPTGPPRGTSRVDWAAAADRHEDRFLADLGEVKRRLADEVPGMATALIKHNAVGYIAAGAPTVLTVPTLPKP